MQLEAECVVEIGERRVASVRGSYEAVFIDGVEYEVHMERIESIVERGLEDTPANGFGAPFGPVGKLCVAFIEPVTEPRLSNITAFGPRQEVLSEMLGV